MTTTNIKAIHFCNFCGKNQTQVKSLIAGNNSYICDECVNLCMKAIAPKIEEPVQEVIDLIPTKIVDHLDQYIIGQTNAKKTIAVAIYNHLKRIKNPVIDGVEISKSNILIQGSSGVGKSFMVKTLSSILNVPYAVVDATSLSQTGYVGLDPEECLARLYQAAGNDINSAQSGIIFIDECDKIGRKSENTSTTRDVSGEGVQQALLKIIEGSDVKFSPIGGRKNPSGDFVTINTNNILFILGGAFEGLDKIIQSRIGEKDSKIGFISPNVSDSSDSQSILLTQAQSEDLIQFGMIPELVGRVPIFIHFDDLDKETLCRILIEPKNSLIKQFQKLFELDGVSLEFDTGAIEAIADQVISVKTGARGLRSVIERVLMNTQYQLPVLKSSGVSKILINEDNIKNNTEPSKIFVDQ